MRITLLQRWNELVSILPKGKSKEQDIAPTSWFGSYYIGPTRDEVMKALPTPVHAADYIAQQHDLEYQALELNGISGTLNPMSNEADARLVERCNELLRLHDQGYQEYHGYPITEESCLAAKFMREYFLIEENVSDFLHRMSFLQSR